MAYERLVQRDAGHDVGTRFIGRHIQYYPRLTSTMDAAREAALAGGAEGTVVLAGEQTAGRGRLGRGWLSPSGCLTFSLVLYPEAHLLPGLVMVTTLAVAETITTVASVPAGIKWPNDVQVGGKKICGILVETGMRADLTNYAIVGVGLNVNFDAAAYPEIGATATSLSVEVGRELSCAEVLHTLLVRFEHWYEAYLGGEPVFEAWRTSLTTIGQAVQVYAGGVLHDGVAEDVAPDGALLLRQRDGHIMKVLAGDVTLKAPSAEDNGVT